MSRAVGGLLTIVFFFAFINLFGPVSTWLLSLGVSDVGASFGAIALIFGGFFAISLAVRQYV